MYLTVCPLHGPGHDSSVGEWMVLTVCPPRGPGHDSSVGEWMYLTVCPLRSPGLIPGHGGISGISQEIISGWSLAASYTGQRSQITGSKARTTAKQSGMVPPFVSLMIMIYQSRSIWSTAKGKKWKFFRGWHICVQLGALYLCTIKRINNL